MRISYPAGAAALLSASAAAAADVTLSGTLANSCTLSLSAPGVLAPASGATEIGSEQAGGSAATLNMTAIGAFPHLTFTAPSLTASPSGWSASPMVEIRYTSSGGANQDYTSSSSSHQATTLLETFTVHGRVTSSEGFAAGTYTLQTTVTCQQ